MYICDRCRNKIQGRNGSPVVFREPGTTFRVEVRNKDGALCGKCKLALCREATPYLAPSGYGDLYDMTTGERIRK